MSLDRSRLHLTAYERMAAECEPCLCPCHEQGPCERGGCCYGRYLCNSERNRP